VASQQPDWCQACSRTRHRQDVVLRIFCSAKFTLSSLCGSGHQEGKGRLSHHSRLQAQQGARLVPAEVTAAHVLTSEEREPLLQLVKDPHPVPCPHPMPLPSVAPLAQLGAVRGADFPGLFGALATS
jgi:hypothetical protein